MGGRDAAARVERGSVAATGKGRGRPPTGRVPSRKRFARRRLRLLWGVVVVVAAVYLYYRPLSSYFETRRDLTARQAEVEVLRQARAALQLRLASSSSVESTEREARRLGYVKPNEQLFFVKGVSAWRKAHAVGRRRSAP